MRIVNNIEEFEQKWDDIISDLPGAHFLQTREWGQIKTNGGWITIPAVWEDDTGNPFAAALILERSIKLLGFIPASILYVPRGPLVDWKKSIQWKTVIRDLAEYARKRGAIFIKIDPECLVGTGIPSQLDENNDFAGKNIIEELKKNGWKLSQDQIQYRNTVWINLELTEDDWLARLKQKTRYNIRLATKKGVSVRKGTHQDLPMLYSMYAETSMRDDFAIRSRTYYLHVWETFMKHDMGVPLIAEVVGDPVAGLFLIHFAGKAWYIYGMSRNIHREKMPTYLLQWEAMREAKAQGCSQYDLWGAPNVFDPQDSMWGVYRFKEGFGGDVIRFIGAWDYPVNLFKYKVFTFWLPKLLDIMRHWGRKKTQREVSI